MVIISFIGATVRLVVGCIKERERVVAFVRSITS